MGTLIRVSPGKSLDSNSRYKKLRVLGRGGMGQVIECEDSILKRHVAMKLLKSESSMDEKLVLRFQKEAKATAKLNHPNIIKVLDFGAMDEGPLYLSMELLDGVSLAQYLAEQGQLEIEDALDIIVQICLGLEHAHKFEILHRDIKPSNVMLTKNHEGERLVKLIDFGIASVRADEDLRITNTGAIVGSPLYMSPGTNTSEDYDARTDIYALGCLIFELLTGEPPFLGENSMATVMMHMNDDAPTLSEKAGAEFSDELEAIISKCLEKNRENRYQSVQELRYDIQDYWQESLDVANSVEDEDMSKPSIERPGIGLFSKSNILAILLLTATISIGCFVALELIKPEESKYKVDLSGKVGAFKDPSIDELSSGDYKANLFVDDKFLEHEFSKSNGNKYAEKQSLVLRFAGSEVKGPGLAFLPDSVGFLEFNQTMITDQGLDYLSRFPRLERLILHMNDALSPNAMKGVGKCKSLVYLNYRPRTRGLIANDKDSSAEYDLVERNMNIAFGANEFVQVITLDEYKEIAKLKNLKKLVLSDQKLVPAKVKLLNRLDNLEELKFINSAVFSSDVVKEFRGFKSLRALSLSDTILEDKAFSELAKLKLDYIKLDKNQRILKYQANQFIKMKYLKTLVIPAGKGIMEFIRSKRPDIELSYND